MYWCVSGLLMPNDSHFSRPGLTPVVRESHDDIHARGDDIAPVVPAVPGSHAPAGRLDLPDELPVDRQDLQVGIRDESVDRQGRPVRDDIRVGVDGELVELQLRGDRGRLQAGQPAGGPEVHGPGSGINSDGLDVVVDQLSRRALDGIGCECLGPVG